MQNKANLKITKMLLSPYLRSSYENLSAKSAVKNKAKQSQFAALTFYPYTPFYQCLIALKNIILFKNGGKFL